MLHPPLMRQGIEIIVNVPQSGNAQVSFALDSFGNRSDKVLLLFALLLKELMHFLQLFSA